MTYPRLVLQCFCRSGVVGVPIYRELVGCALAEGGVVPVGVVVPSVVLGNDFDFHQRVEYLDGQEFVAEFAWVG